MIVAKHSDWKPTLREKPDDPIPLPCIACKGRKMVALNTLPAPNELSDPIKVDLRWCAACDGCGHAAEGFEWRTTVKPTIWLDLKVHAGAMSAALADLSDKIAETFNKITFDVSPGGWPTSVTVPVGYTYIPAGTFVVAGNAGGTFTPVSYPIFDVLGDLTEAIPGLRYACAQCPCTACALLTPTPVAVTNLIPHLNDTARWSREEIADWLETLDVDLTFQPKEKAA